LRQRSGEAEASELIEATIKVVMADPRIIEQTGHYIRDFDRIAENTRTAQELFEQVLGFHPDRVNQDALWHSAYLVKP
jgi:hypothetical protein